MAERIIGRPLGGRIMHSGSLSRFRRKQAGVERVAPVRSPTDP